MFVKVKNIGLIAVFLACVSATNLRAEDELSLLKSAHMGNVAAMRKIGIRMHKRLSSRGTPTEGLQWLKKAVDFGDAEAAYYLGRFYLPNNKKLGESYMRMAAEEGHAKAQKYFDEIVEVKKGAWEDQVGAVRLNKAIEKAVAEMQEKTTDAGIKRIAMVEFLCNGGVQNDLTDAVRGKIQEAILNGSAMVISDRVDVKMLAEESVAQGDDLAINSATAVFMGEIICKPGGDVGYFIYRVFRTKDMRIIAAGFVPVKWTSFEKELLRKIPLKIAPATLPYTPKRDLDNMVACAREKVHGGIAMVHNRNESDNDTVEHRVAFAQVLDAFFKGGLTLYEREFMEEGANEAAVSDETVQAERVGALCAVKLVTNRGKNGLEVRLTSYPEGNLLFVSALTQTRGSVIRAM